MLANMHALRHLTSPVLVVVPEHAARAPVDCATGRDKVGEIRTTTLQGDPQWLSGSRSLLGEAPHPPTRGLLKRWPELLEYRSISLPPSGRLRRRLGWKVVVLALTLDDGVRAVVTEEYPSWWPIWPLRKIEAVSMSSPRATDRRNTTPTASGRLNGPSVADLMKPAAAV
jgi:hypothetical protein